MSGTIERLRGRPELSVLPDWSEAGFPVMDTHPEKHGVLTITVPVPPADHRRSLRS